jgi:hypothetical protein
VADYINNVAAGDLYTPECSLGPDFAAKYAVVTIANNPALMQFAKGKIGDWRWTDEREFQSIPQSFRVGNVIGLRVRNASPGNVARVLAVLAGDDDPDFQSGVPFTGVLGASGGVTPGGATVEIDHNGVAISTQPKVDFEDTDASIWAIVDDPANTRVVIKAPRFLTGQISSAGAIIAGSGFTVIRNAVGVYTVTFNVAFPAVPTVTASTVAGGTGDGIQVSAKGVGSFIVHGYDTNTQAARDEAFDFIAMQTG